MKTLPPLRSTTNHYRFPAPNKFRYMTKRDRDHVRSRSGQNGVAFFPPSPLFIFLVFFFGHMVPLQLKPMLACFFSPVTPAAVTATVVATTYSGSGILCSIA